MANKQITITISDAANKLKGPAGSVTSITTSGTGNVVSNITLNSDKSLTVTKSNIAYTAGEGLRLNNNQFALASSASKIVSLKDLNADMRTNKWLYICDIKEAGDSAYINLNLLIQSGWNWQTAQQGIFNLTFCKGNAGVSNEYGLTVFESNPNYKELDSNVFKVVDNNGTYSVYMQSAGEQYFKATAYGIFTWDNVELKMTNLASLPTASDTIKISPDIKANNTRIKVNSNILVIG